VVRLRPLVDRAAGFEQLAKFFGEDPKTSTPKTFFGTLWEFLEALDRAAIELKQRAEQEKLAAQRAAQSEAMKKHIRSNQRAGWGPPPEQRGMPVPVVDELIATLKGGVTFVERGRPADEEPISLPAPLEKRGSIGSRQCTLRVPARWAPRAP